MIADHQRRAPAAQRRVHVVVEPARVAELEGVASRGQLVERGFEARAGRSGNWRAAATAPGPSLPASISGSIRSPNRSQPSADRREALDVRQVAARLHGEHEVGRRLRDPVRDRVAGGKPVEGVVDLDGAEVLRVVLEPPPRGQSFGIERLAPVGVVPARAADQDATSRGCVSSRCARRPGLRNLRPGRLPPLRWSARARRLAAAALAPRRRFPRHRRKTTRPIRKNGTATSADAATVSAMASAARKTMPLISPMETGDCIPS